MAEVERLCDAVVMMREGRIVDRGAPADRLIARYGRRTLEEVFLDIARRRGPGQPGDSGDSEDFQDSENSQDSQDSVGR